MLRRALRQLAAFGWGFVLALLLFSWCNNKGQNSRGVVIVRDTVYLKELVRDTVVTVKERLLGWVKVKPETVLVSPETVLVETVWGSDTTAWSVYYARNLGERLHLVAGRAFKDTAGRLHLAVRSYTFPEYDDWVLVGGDTGLALKGRYRWRVRPFVGFGWDSRFGAWPLVGVRLAYKGWEGRVWVGQKVGMSVERAF